MCSTVNVSEYSSVSYGAVTLAVSRLPKGCSSIIPSVSRLQNFDHIDLDTRYFTKCDFRIKSLKLSLQTSFPTVVFAVFKKRRS